MPSKYSQHAKTAVKANKKLGQHFLTDDTIIQRIVHAINPESAQNLLEIGPGLGAITLPVLQQAKELTAIELDRRVIPLLQKQAAPLGQLTIIEQDVLNVDYAQLLQNGHWHVFGNLPYNISTPILFTLSAAPQIKDMVFMLQKEVVDRMIAEPNDKNYGRLSVMLQYHHDIFPLFDVPPTAFSPPPKVMSAMVGMTRLSKPRWEVSSLKLFQTVVKQAFSMRRKTLRNTLKPLLTADALISLGIDPTLRAEAVSGHELALITRYLYEKTP